MQLQQLSAVSRSQRYHALLAAVVIHLWNSAIHVIVQQYNEPNQKVNGKNVSGKRNQIILTTVVNNAIKYDNKKVKIKSVHKAVCARCC